MSKLFIYQLIISFFVGGFVIALLGYIAERANKKIAGSILSLPSTALIAYIFMAWTVSPSAAAQVVPATIAANLAVSLFTIAFVYLSKIKLPRIYSIILSFLGALAIWSSIAIPIAIFKFSHIVASLILYSIGLIMGYYFLTKKNNAPEHIAPLTYSLWQKIGRALFAGSIITLAVYLSKTLHPFWGGVLSSFPATYSSTFIILRWYYDPGMLSKVARSIPFGS
ncbi:MAG: hypothetical protein A2479_01845, partial [Candidatus Magasanikbacteria bacterium RIFOXYC2_FULL_39_8]